MNAGASMNQSFQSKLIKVNYSDIKTLTKWFHFIYALISLLFLIYF